MDKFSHTRFEPSGFTQNPEIPIAKSITDYIFRWLASKFWSREDQQLAGVVLRDEEHAVSPPAGGTPPFHYQQDAPSCHECGAIVVRNGTCYKCLNCGSTSGCS